MWWGKEVKGPRRRPLIHGGRDGELSPQDAQRIDEIRRSFEENGWQLSVNEERDSWVAWFFHEKLGPSTNDVVRGRTAMEAALGAWDKFRSEPHLGESSVVKTIRDRDEPRRKPQPSRPQARRRKKNHGRQ
jgi:hypothetical protein